MKIVTCFVVLLSGLLTLACASKESASRSARTQEAKTGEQLFVSLCASCHGALGRGDGPVAPFLVTPPSDLTRIAQRNNGSFLADRIHQFIDGRTERMVHGPREMPVWGQRLYFSANPEDAAARAHTEAQISLLVEYLRSIQQF